MKFFPLILLLFFAYPRILISQSITITSDVNSNEENAINNHSPGRYQVGIGPVYYFIANDGKTGEELWRSDGTAGGTTLVKDINPGPGGAGIHDLVSLDKTLFFVASNGTTGDELWRSDGTANGTALVRDINPGFSGSYPHNLLVLGSQVYFAANDGITGDELWRSDGTAAGTSLVTDANPGPNGAYPHELEAMNGQLYFTANTPETGDELWRSNGTASGTALLRDIYAGTAGSYPHELLAVNGLLYFTTNDGRTGDELWRSDGTANGTALVKDLNPGPNGSSPRTYTPIGNVLYFVTHDDDSGDALWRSDGTANGTTLVKPLRSDSNGTYAYELTVLNETLFFVTPTGTTGDELWRSDGTANGTVLVKDINPGPNGAYPHNLVAVGSRLYFTANDGGAGDELWHSDGTANGTALVKDLNPGPNGSYPFNLFNVGGKLFLTANDGTHGQEIWLLNGLSAAAADLAITLVASSRTPRLNEALTYTLSVANQSPNTRLPTATWENRLPPNLTFIDGQGVTHQNGVVTGQATDLDGGSEARFSYRVKPTVSGTYLNAVQITQSALPDPDSRPNSGTGDGEDDTANADIRTADAGGGVFNSPNPDQRPLPAVMTNQPVADLDRADLSLNMVLSQLSAQVQEIVSITLVVSNAGGRTATDVRVVNQLPGGLQFLSGNGWLAENGRLTATIARVGSGEQVTLVFQTRIVGAGPLLNQAQIDASGVADPDSTPGNGFTNGEDDRANATIRTY